MGEYKDLIETKELKTLEIDIEKNIFKLNGDDLKRCSKLEIVIDIDAEKHEVILFSDTRVIFKGWKKMTATNSHLSALY